MKGKQGQGIAIDFLFAVLVFLVLLNASLALIDSSSRSSAEKNTLAELNSRTMQILDMLVRTDGEPDEWQSLGISQVTVIGLAKRDRVLDVKKVEKFMEWAAEDYNKVKSLLLTGYPYYFRLSDYEGMVLEETGRPGQQQRENSIESNVKRIVNYNGGEAIAELTLYYPKA